MKIGERLKNLLKFYRITAREFALMVKVSEGMVYRYYQMEDASYATLSKWADALKVPIVAFTDDFNYRHAINELTEEEREEIELNRMEVAEKFDQIKSDAEKDLKKAIGLKERRIEQLMRHIGKLELLLEQNNIDYSSIKAPSSQENCSD